LEALPLILELFFTPHGDSVIGHSGSSKKVQTTNSEGQFNIIDNGYQYPNTLQKFIPLPKDKSNLHTLSALSQISCCVNIQCYGESSHMSRLRKPYFFYSGSLTGLLSAAPRFEDEQEPKAFILLLSGDPNDSKEVGSGQEVLYAVVCLDSCGDPYMSGSYETAPYGVVYQLAPKFGQFWPSQPSSSSLRPSNPDAGGFSRRMDWDTHSQNLFEMTVNNGIHNWARLTLEQSASTCSKFSSIWGEQERREDIFEINIVEVIIF
jgi:hypothetical protein